MKLKTEIPNTQKLSVKGMSITVYNDTRLERQTVSFRNINGQHYFLSESEQTKALYEALKKIYDPQ